MDSQSFLKQKIGMMRKDLSISHSGGKGGGSSETKQLKVQVRTLEEDLQRRQESAIRRERAMKDRIAELEAKLQKNAELEEGSGRENKMRGLREIHKNIITNVEHFQDKTSKLVQEQERDLLRAFRARLFDVQTELEKEKNKGDDGASLWIEKNRKLEKDLDAARQLADRLERTNKALQKENLKLKQQYQIQEQDREFLVKQLVMCKKDNAKFRQDVDKMKQQMELDPLPSVGRGMPQRAGFSPKNSSSSQRLSTRPASRAKTTYITNVAEESRYKDFVRRLRHLLDSERKQVRVLRQKYAHELKSRTELEDFLRKCISDVKREIADRQQKLLAQPRARISDEVGINDFSDIDRERVMELLLSQERVISLLYEKTFPPKTEAEDEEVTKSEEVALYEEYGRPIPGSTN